MKIIRVFRRRKDLISLYALIALVVGISSFLFPNFRTVTTFSNIFEEIVPVGFVALGQTLAILLSGLDLSVGAVASFATVIAATTMNANFGLGLAIIIFGSTLIGITNGVVITKLKVHPLIATLGMMGIINGINLVLLPLPGGAVPYYFISLVQQRFGVLTLSFFFLLGVAFLLYFFLNYTVIGRDIYASGADESKARSAGVRTDRTKIITFGMVSLLAAIGGLFLGVRMYSGAPRGGESFTLISIAAALLGGTTFAGGVGGIEGTLPAVFLITVISKMLGFLDLSVFYNNIFLGGILILAIVYANIQKGKR